MTDRPKRRWFQFRLRTLMVFVTLCAVACSWFAVKLQQARRQREAVEAIREAGGHVTYDYEIDADGSRIQSPEPPGPAWLRKTLGVDFFSDVRCVYFYALWSGFGDDGMEHLKELPSLQELYLSHTQVGDAGLEHLKGLTSLKWLRLSNTKVSNAGLEHLRGLTSLRELRLYDTQVTDAGIYELKKALPNCIIIH